jgi:hypothetical protein
MEALMIARYRRYMLPTTFGLSLGAVLHAGCGDDSSDGSPSGAGPSASSATSGAGGGQCSVMPDDECEECAVANCPEESDTCCLAINQMTMVGCLDIVDCARETGCSGTDCYSPENCQEVIVDAGDLGSPVVNAALALSTCVTMECGDCAAGGAGGGGGAGGAGGMGGGN